MAKTVTFAILHFTVAFSVGYALTGDIVIGGAVALTSSDGPGDPVNWEKPHHELFAQAYEEMLEFEKVGEFLPGRLRMGPALELYKADPAAVVFDAPAGAVLAVGDVAVGLVVHPDGLVLPVLGVEGVDPVATDSLAAWSERSPRSADEAMNRAAAIARPD